MLFNEDTFEQAVIELFENMGYTHIYAPDMNRTDYSRPLLDDALRDCLVRLNRNLPVTAIDEAILKLNDFDAGSLLQKNMVFMDYLQNGITVKYVVNGEERSSVVRLIDYTDAAKNDFYVVNQYTFVENGNNRRPDIILFINGMPLVLMELKSPSKDEVGAENAYNQIRNYMQDVPSMFYYNAICVISDLSTNKAGTITSGLDRFMEWKTTDGSYESTSVADFETLFNGMFKKERLVDIITHFTMAMGTDKKARILAGYHQYFAVKKAMECTKEAIKRQDGKIGVFWHTQGSGKSLSMVFYAHQLLHNLLSSTILVLTDRLDLNEQLYGTFSACCDYLRQQPVMAKDGEHLYELLETRQSRGIIFANLQKFKDRKTPLTTRKDIIVLSDEAHRSQSNTQTKVDTETGELKLGFAAIVRKLLPGASFIGFTGTPIEADDHDTREVFGNYIDIYDMTQAVEDGATVPVYYESRLIKLDLDAETMKLLDQEYDKLAEEGASDEDLKRSKQENARLHALLRAPETIDTLCRDLVQHYEECRKNHLTGKAMIVAIDRATGIDIYRKLCELRPDWKEIIGVVMTSGNQDPVEWADIIGSAAHKEQLARDFKDNSSKMKIAIVVDMWLTGFDVPSLATMYVYKPMKGHNLMQAIARVNRVFPEKSGGLVVDYIGIAGALKKAMHDYTGRDKKNFGNQDIKQTAYEQFLEAISMCRLCISDLVDYSTFATCTNLQRSRLIREGLDTLLIPDRMVPGCPSERTMYDENGNIIHVHCDPVLTPVSEVFSEYSKRMMQAATICRSILTPEEKFEEAYFEAVRTLFIRLTSKAPITRKIIDERISELLKVAIQSDGVVEIINTKGEEFSLFDEQFLNDVANMKEKNLAIEMLKKLLAQHIKKHQKKNLTQAELFSEMLDKRLAEYLRGMISNEEVIKELLEMAKLMKQHAEEGNALGLSDEEQAFYDALTRPRAVKDFYENNQLVAMAREITDALRKNRTLDWRQKETARAKMRTMIKRLLKKYHYPPEEAQNAIEVVMRQCELWADNEE